MNFVSYLGEYIATLIDKPPNAMKDLILISIQAQLGKDAIYVMRLNQVITIIKGALKSRLEVLGVKNLDEIVKKLCEKVNKEQSILIMMAI